jgi:hypothetical protein
MEIEHAVVVKKRQAGVVEATFKIVGLICKECESPGFPMMRHDMLDTLVSLVDTFLTTSIREPRAFHS